MQHIIPNHIKYRGDIDGLRALAVLSVIIFHINSKLIPGGFLGVDIFFVISGYLITLILIKEVKQTNKINIVNFYKRRIKRIVPALLFVLIFTFLAALIILLPNDLLKLSESMIWSFFSSANIYFFSSIDTGYFAEASNELPLLHLWSLGVEEQFYILWPFIILFLIRYITTYKKIILIVSILFISSLLLAQLTIIENHSFAYYMLPTRSWELLAGAIVAIIVNSGFKIRNSISELMAFVGFLLIILSFIFVSESDPVPGIAALPVIIGATFLILSGVSNKTFIGKFLSFKLFVAIGLVSYSAYLWHWPILAFVRYLLIEINFTVAVIIFTFTITMATISYFMVETPFRENKISTKKIFIWYFIIPSLIIISLYGITSNIIKNKNELFFPWSQLKQVKSQALPAYKYKYNCQYPLFDTKAYEDNRCVYPENSKNQNVFLVGDSNAAHYLGMLRVFADHYGFNIRNATQSACPLLLDSKLQLDWIRQKYKKGCSIYRESVFEEMKKYDTVFIGGSWIDYYNKDEFQKSFKKTIDMLSKNIKHIVLLAKVPVFPNYNKECEARSTRFINLDCNNLFTNNIPDNESNKFLQDIANNYKNIYYFNIRDQLCNNSQCSPYINNNSVYYDKNHLSMKGSEQIGHDMIEKNSTSLQVIMNLYNKNY